MSPLIITEDYTDDEAYAPHHYGDASLTDQTECVTEAEIPEMTSRRQLASRGSCDSSNGKRQSTSTK